MFGGATQCGQRQRAAPPRKDRDHGDTDESQAYGRSIRARRGRRSAKRGAAAVRAGPTAAPARDADPDCALNARLDKTRFVLDEAAYAKVMIDDPLEPTEAQKKFMAVRTPA